MKKIFAVIVVVVAIAVSVFMFRGGKKPSDLIKSISSVSTAGPSLASIVPKDAACFVGVYNINGNYQAFKASNFFKQLSSLKLWEDIDLENTLDVVISNFKTQSGVELSEKNIMELIGRQLAGAILVNTSHQKVPSIVLMTRVGTKTRLLSKLMGFVDQESSGYEKTSYNGVSIYGIKATEESPMDSSFCVVKDIMILEIGTETKNTNGVIDLVKSSDKKGSLLKNLYYQNVVEEKENLVYEFFINTKEALDAVNSPDFPGEFKTENLQTAVTTALKTMDSVGSYGKFTDGFYTKTVVVPNEKIDNEMLKKLWHAKPKKSKSISFAPKNTIFFGASNSLDIPVVWETWQDSVANQSAEDASIVMDSLNSLENNLGLSIKDDFLPILGDEFSYMLSGIDIKDDIPIPQIAFMFKIKDVSLINYIL